MKNKLKILIVSSIILIIFQKISFSKEILLNSEDIHIYDNGNVIVAINGPRPQPKILFEYLLIE